ncbi:hypothetical protein BTIS_1457 [Bifidobacterium tissieri]|uniref:Uncharacterized protein n=1 Tax=Bifidobacterium tissieri TaxID=1630162 RepID=A0A261FEG8_9BIFI|nr:hypothetical protein [Bifidobacterium tissieri]OZG57363.1 hypothetical protein BTIS_1457 [Bifidobacterium tissieri]
MSRIRRPDQKRGWVKVATIWIALIAGIVIYCTTDWHWLSIMLVLGAMLLGFSATSTPVGRNDHD